VVFKTRIKRSELMFNLIILAMFALVASFQLLSAYGASCVVWDSTWWGNIVYAPSPPFPPGWIASIMFTYMVEWGLLFQIMNVFTWILGFAWGFLLYAYFTKWPLKRIFIAGMVVAALGLVTGLVPALIADLNYTPVQGLTGLTWDMTTQSWVPAPFEIGANWSRVIPNAIMLGVLLVLYFVPRFKVAATKFLEERSIVGQYVKQLILMSLFFFWLGAVSFLGTEFMRAAHVEGGINVWQTIDLQFYGGVVTTAIGATMLSTALIYHKIRPTSARIEKLK
jgi:hypothetical protein